MGQRQAERHAGQRQNDGLGEQLPDDASASRSEGNPDGELATSRRRTGEQQVGDIRAGDEEHEGDACHHQAEQKPDVVGEKRFVQRPDPGAPASVESGVRTGKAPGNRVEILLRARLRDIRRETSKREEIAPVSTVAGHPRLQGKPQSLVLGKRKVDRHHADHGVRHAVDQDSPPQDLAIGRVARAPQPVTEQDDAAGIRLILALGEVAAKNRMRAQQSKHVPGDGRRLKAFRLPCAVCHRDRPLSDGCDRRE